ncbi:hypothetical protein ASZ78_011859 [Callipepla squamata]|uniref:Ubiquitin-like domain-containing protein n=1 Tax=Callipepla squamata TaxID=9009 RepID=A0A226MVH5_CALSU|nr:hypothetical protein ASZ78_011859 [Callipepla squamata]
MPRSSSLQPLGIQLRLAETNELFSLPQCHNDLTLKKLKSDLELLTGIPFHFQRLHYLDEIDLPDNSTLMDNDTVPGGTITMRIWRQDGWGHLVAAAAGGDTVQNGNQCRFSLALLSPIEGWHWFLPERTSSAGAVAVLSCNVTSRELRPTAATAPFCCPVTLRLCFFTDADVHSKTPLGRTALHVAAAMGRCECIELLLSCGARALDPDGEGQTALRLAQRWGQKRSERNLMRALWQPAGARPQHQGGTVRQSHGLKS